METLSKQVARVEKELGFWGKMYPEGIPVINGITISQQVQQLQYHTKAYREIYREELQRDLGEEFSVEPLQNERPHNPMRNYFFPIEYNKKPFGIILPFREQKKVIFASPSNKTVYESASKVFSNRKYEVEILPHQLIQGDRWCLTVDEDIFNHLGEL